MVRPLSSSKFIEVHFQDGKVVRVGISLVSGGSNQHRPRPCSRII